MKLDDLDQILLSEKTITPSASFGPAVLSRIQTEASPRLPLPFPWIPFVLSLLLVVILSAFFFSADPGLRSMHQMFYDFSEWIGSPMDPTLKNAVLAACASLLGTLMLLWFSLRLIDARR
jgi:hypothetical protein